MRKAALQAIDLANIMIEFGIDIVGNGYDFRTMLADAIMLRRLTTVRNITIFIVSHMRFRRLIAC